MRFLTLALLTLAPCSPLAAQAPLHRIELKSSSVFEVASPTGVTTIDIHSLSESMRRVAQPGSRKTPEAADYANGVKIRTKDPQAALQEIIRQIDASTNRPPGKFLNSRLVEIAPAAAAITVTTDANLGWFFALAPKGEADAYLLICGYVFDRLKPPSQP